MQKIYIDFDGVTVDHLEVLMSLYNKDYNQNIKKEDIQTWNMPELHLATKSQRLAYFEDDRFFEQLQFMPYFVDAVRYLDRKGIYELHELTMGTPVNIKKKTEWLNSKIADIGVKIDIIALNSHIHRDKSCIDMTGAVLIDDKGINLITSNAEKKIVFGPEKNWNTDFNGDRMTCWSEIKKFL